MPVYCHICPKCQHECEDVRPISRAMENPPCPNGCGTLGRNWPAEMVGVVASRAYESASLGVPPGVMRNAVRDEHGNWRQRCTRELPGGGTETYLSGPINPRGFDLHPVTGNVIVPDNRGTKRELLKRGGEMLKTERPLVDYGPDAPNTTEAPKRKPRIRIRPEPVKA